MKTHGKSTEGQALKAKIKAADQLLLQGILNAMRLLFWISILLLMVFLGLFFYILMDVLRISPKIGKRS